MVEFFILRGVKRGEEWLWQATHDEYAAHAPFKLEQYVGADGGTRWDVRNATGDAIYTGLCYAQKPLDLVQDRCVPLTWSASPHQEPACPCWNPPITVHLGCPIHVGSPPQERAGR